MEHYPVLKREVLEYINLKDGGIYVDGTCGHGGHSGYLLEQYRSIYVYGMDKDAAAVNAASKNLARFPNFRALHSGYEKMDVVLRKCGVAHVDGVLLDLGFSSNQVKDASRGFSFQLEGPLDMRYDASAILTAHDVVNRWPASDLVWLFETYGEVKKARKFVAALVERRKKKKFEMTTDLADFIVKYHGRRQQKKLHPATRFFMAIRIAVNDEIENVKTGLQKACEVLERGGRLVVISFHSLEDRVVKHFFRENEQLEVLTKKPVVPRAEETARNPESRSAKLRACEKK